MSLPRFAAAATAVAVVLAGWIGSAAAQSYPSRPIRLVVPFAAGQGADAASRVVAQKLSDLLRQPVVVDNRPGAGGNVGTEVAARSPADGYTLLIGSNGTHAANAALYASLPFDPEKDFVPISYVGSVAMVLLAPPASPWGGLRDAIDAARARPDSIGVAIPSSTSRVVLELLTKSSGARFNPVAYKASAGAMSDLMGGHVPLSIDTIIAARPQVVDGKLKALAVSSARRSGGLPEVPTFGEAGLGGFDLVAWNVVFAPRGTPPELVARLNAEIRRTLADPEVQAKLRALGYEPGGTEDPTQVAGFVRDEARKWGDLIRGAGIRAE